ncbi:hypothetical protein BpHYR1_018676 [Brachionus plicatilis]|uniref:Uncharacterized protein n=1 Tax=Brachionus plicatilis TaxID=10195 RepID=A0A3M7T5X8_BRAPC|nr:hypothetical protein BpHYR1_018676 [Brachionus plicatilis]
MFLQIVIQIFNDNLTLNFLCQITFKIRVKTFIIPLNLSSYIKKSNSIWLESKFDYKFMIIRFFIKIKYNNIVIA